MTLGGSGVGRAVSGGAGPILAVLLVAVLAACGAGPSPTRAPTLGPSPPATASPAIDPVSGLPEIWVEALPPEARVTIKLIRSGGPFPYPQDGTVFGNREGLLPGHPWGWYREYTVETPGSSDRSARRIVAGADGTFYWTDDHYASFWAVVR